MSKISTIDNGGQPAGGYHRILSIDGGGILGVLPAATLAALEAELDRPIGDYFDLIVGTSTGGILAIGLGMGYSASDLLSFYVQEGPSIFAQNRARAFASFGRRMRAARWLFRPKYNSEALRSALAVKLAQRRIGHSRSRLVIPAWNPLLREVYIYKTAHHPRLRKDYKALALDAAMATSSAPTYFHRHITQDDVGLIDGGVWANNPIAIAVVEAVSLLGWPGRSLHVLSLGCLEETYLVSPRAGLGTLGMKARNLFMDGQSHGAMGIAKLLTGAEHEREAIFRIDHQVPYKAFRLDDVSVIADLKGLGFAKGRERYPLLAPIFFNQPAERFIPYYQLDEEAT